MNIAVEKQPKCIAILNVEVPSADVAAKRQSITSSYASQAKLPGFRPGKAPKAVIEKRFGKQISEELTEALLVKPATKPLKLRISKSSTSAFPTTSTNAPTAQSLSKPVSSSLRNSLFPFTKASRSKRLPPKSPMRKSTPS